MNAGIEPGSGALIDRVKGIILKPKEEWPRIETERKSQAEILTGYVLPLAAIGPVASFLGGQIFGYGAMGFSYKPSLMGALGTLVLSYVLAIVAVYVLAFIANFLAEKFEGTANSENAFKLVAYGATAAWLAGIFSLIPMLGVFGLLGLYSIYLIYTGSGPLMKVPEAKQASFTAVTFVCAIILNLLVGLIAGAVIGIGALGGGAASIAGKSGNDDVTVSIPGVGSIDTGKIQEAADRAEKIQKGEIKPVETEMLKGMLPEAVAGFSRTGMSTQAMGQAGSGVEATYKKDGYSFDLKVSDMLMLSGLAGIGSAMKIEQTREDENGYERTGNVDGQWRTENWNTQSNRGTYSVMIADRFMVEASGNVPSIDVLKNAVGEINAGDLEDMAD